MKLNEEIVKNETYYSELHYKSLKKKIEKYEADPNKEYRLKNFLCKTCFYLKNGFAGQAFTKFECKNCDKEEHYPNTNVPKYCFECAGKHDCCVRCASKI